MAEFSPGSEHGPGEEAWESCSIVTAGQSVIVSDDENMHFVKTSYWIWKEGWVREMPVRRLG